MLKKLQTKYRNACIGVAVLAGPLVAMASTPADPFDATVATMTTRVGGYGAALVGLAAVGVGFAIGIKYVKKIRGAA